MIVNQKQIREWVPPNRSIRYVLPFSKNAPQTHLSMSLQASGTEGQQPGVFVGVLEPDDRPVWWHGGQGAKPEPVINDSQLLPGGGPRIFVISNPTDKPVFVSGSLTFGPPG